MGRTILTDFHDAVKKRCRYEIFIPLNYNNGDLVEAEKILNTEEEIMEKFGVLTTYPVSLRASGLWKSGDQIFHDKLLVYRLDVGTNDVTLKFFVEYKEKLEKYYNQIKIYMTRQRIEII